MSDQFGPYRINPAFDRHPDEARLIGRILASFGEIELLITVNAGQATHMMHQVQKALYRLRMTSARIEAADALAKPVFHAHRLLEEYTTTQMMVVRCLAIRNQYAHCNWADDPSDYSSGLFFADLQEAAKSDEQIDINLAYRHVDVALLDEQMRCFQTTVEWLNYLGVELANREGRLRQAWPMPVALTLPPLHNPPEAHVPPWLSQVHKDRHLARARAANGGPPTPTPKQQAQDNARQEKRAKRQADRERTAAQRSENARLEPDEPR